MRRLFLFLTVCGLLTATIGPVAADEATSATVAPPVIANALGDPVVPPVNPEAPSAATQFSALQLHGDALGFNLPPGRETWNEPDGCRHYQGMARVNAPDGTPYLVLTRSGNWTGSWCVDTPNPFDPVSNYPGELLVVEMASRDRDGERLRSNKLKPGVDMRMTQAPPEDKVVEQVFLDGTQGWPASSHPGGIQAVGDVLVVPHTLHCPEIGGFGPDHRCEGLVKDARISLVKVNFVEKSSIVVGQPRYEPTLSLLNTFHLDQSGVGFVGVAYVPGGPPSPHPDGRYLFVIKDGDGLRFAWTDSNRLDHTTSIQVLPVAWEKDDLGTNAEHWHNWEVLNLVTEADTGHLYLIGAEKLAGSTAEDLIGLFRVLPDRLTPAKIAESIEFVEIEHIQLNEPNMGSLDAASGVYVSPTGQLILYTGPHDNDDPNGSVEVGEFRNIDVYHEGTAARESMCPWVEFYDDTRGWDDDSPDTSLMLDFADRRIEDHWWRLDAVGFGDKASAMRWHLAADQKLVLFYDENWDFGKPHYTLTGPETGFMASLKDVDGLHDNIDSVFMYPFADPGGPYTAVAGEAVTLDDAGRCYSSKLTYTARETYKWRVVSGLGCSFADPTASQPTLTCTDTGTFEIELSVTEPAAYWMANEATATTEITVTPPPPPPSVGLVNPVSGEWYLRDGEGEFASFYYGNPGDVPFMGDWNCDTVATPGLFRTSDAFAYLRNSNTQGIADIRFFFGNPSDIPLAGDFNGNGCDTLSIYRPSEARFYIINKLGENEGGLGAAEYSFLFGNPGDKPVVGDWDGDGIDEIGLHRESSGFFYYRNTLTTGIADGQFYFGDPGDRFVAGDWGTVDGVETPAMFRPSNSTFYFRHTLTQGNADSQFIWTGAGSNWLPVAGDFTLD